MIGYNKSLYILPFDHRSSFTKGLFGIEGRPATEEEKEKVKDFKKVIYEAFRKALFMGVPSDGGAILVDEEFGSEILLDARKKGYTTILTTEKSGQEVFDFEYGDNFQEHLLEFKPTFAKALLRYNPEDKEKNMVQLERLKLLSDFCDESGIKLLIEPLVPPSERDLEEAGGDKQSFSAKKKFFDREIRPELMVEMIKEFQDKGVEPDIWKIEGLSEKLEYQHVVHQARAGEGREKVGIVILGRGESREMVEEWIRAGREVEGVVGFAVGRTVFWDALVLLRDKGITREEAVEKIAKNYLYFYQLFANKL